MDPPELQQHAGVYARLGAFVSSQGKSKPTSGRAKRHDCHKDLQVRAAPLRSSGAFRNGASC